MRTTGFPLPIGLSLLKTEHLALIDLMRVAVDLGFSSASPAPSCLGVSQSAKFHLATANHSGGVKATRPPNAPNVETILIYLGSIS